MAQVPTIEKYMTPTPYVVEQDEPLGRAIEKMEEHRIRHLPVQKGNEIVGILSDRNVKVANSTRWRNLFSVEDVMTPEPYIVGPDTPLPEIIDTMIAHKYGCAIIQDRFGAVAGIFTTIDALKVLKSLLLDSEIEDFDMEGADIIGERWPYWD